MYVPHRIETRGHGCLLLVFRAGAAHEKPWDFSDMSDPNEIMAPLTLLFTDTRPTAGMFLIIFYFFKDFSLFSGKIVLQNPPI